MMVAIFTMMTLAFAAVLFGPLRLAVAAVLVGLVLSIGLFLYEIDSPQTGFSMPWLQGMAGSREAERPA